MIISKTIKQVRAEAASAREKKKTIGFVPTMGDLHAGHVSLIRAAVAKCDFVVVSIFVNPTQFGPTEDFEKYPRPIEKDLAICENEKVDVVFAPADKEMYPTETFTWVKVEKITESLCGRSRPGHFKGVTTVCAKLFNIVTPDFAFFGQKDAQQAIVIKKMVEDLNLGLEIIICPTVREKSGLAMSSRNKYLTEKQKNDAGFIYEALKDAEKAIAKGEDDTEKIIQLIKNNIQKIPQVNIEYINIVDTETLEEMKKIFGAVLIAVAVKIGTTRLIDNILIDVAKQ